MIIIFYEIDRDEHFVHIQEKIISHTQKEEAKSFYLDKRERGGHGGR